MRTWEGDLALLDRLKMLWTPDGHVTGNGSAPPEAKSTTRTIGTSPADFWPQTADDPLDGLDRDRTILLASYVLYAILQYRAQKLNEAPPYIGREDENGEFEAVPHPHDDLFREPNPDEDWHDLSWVTQFLLDLDGRALWTQHRDGAGQTRLIRVYHEHEFTVHPGVDRQGMRRLYGRFRVQHAEGVTWYDAEDVVHWRIPHPYDRSDTLSPTDAVLGMLGIAGELRTRVKALVRNAAVPGGFFMRPAEAGRMGDEEFARSKRELNANYQSANSGRVGLLEGGMEYIRTSLSLEEIQFGSLWREIEAACCAAFNIRPEVLGFLVGLENAPWSHMSTARRLVYEDSAIPTWGRWSRTLTRQLLSREDRAAGLTVQFDTSGIGVLKEDMDRMSRLAVRMGDDLSVNERRMLVGKEKTGNPDHDIVKGKADTSAPREPSDTAPPTVAGIKGPWATKALDRAEAWKVFDLFATSEEERLEGVARALLRDDREWVAGLYRDEVEVEVKETTEARVARMIARLNREWDEARGAKWTALMAPQVRRTALAAARNVAEVLSVSFDLMIPGVDRYAATHAAQLVTQVGDTTKDAIRQHLATGLRNGEDIPTMARRIQEAGAFSDSRATLIARTESTTVTNGSQVEGLIEYAEATGQRVTKEWLATQDDRTRDDHMVMDGVKVDIDADFDTPDLGPIPAPQAPNCRCTTVFAVVRDNEEGDA